MIRKWMCAFLVLMILTGCAGKGGLGEEETLDLESAGETVGKSRGSVTAVVTPSNASEPKPETEIELDIPQSAHTGAAGRLSVESTVAYAFEGTLYGGFTYTNTGGEPMLLTEAQLTFAYAGNEHTESYQPFMGVDDILMPGETACATLFAHMEGAEPAWGDIALSVELTGEAAEATAQRLEVLDARLIQNYPGFATLSGRIVNNTQQVSGLCMVYVQFYDENQALIGIWYFTRNALLQPGQDSAFVVHLQSLPAQGLADRTASMRFRAFRL